MFFQKFNWQDRLSQHPNQRILKNLDNGAETIVEIFRDEGEIGQEGTAFKASNMNNLEDRIASAINPVILYSNDAGMPGPGPFTIPYNYTEFKIIDIYFGFERNFGLTSFNRLFPEISDRVSLSIIYTGPSASSPNADDTLYTANTFLKFSGTSVTFDGGTVQTAIRGNDSLSIKQDNNLLKIYRIFGYK